MIKISVAKDFTRFPSGRFIKNGATSGEGFREKFIIPHLLNNERIEINLDNTLGYGSSFLEEAFGGTIRKMGISKNEFHKLVKITSEDIGLINEINGYIEDASRIK